MRVLPACVILMCYADAGFAADTNALLTAWLNAQTNIQSWSADFTQTRTLKSLAQPLTAAGKVWFVAPDRFRWELGDPAQTIAVRQRDQMTLLYPKLKRAERYPLDGAATGPWKDALALLEAGFPRSRAEMDARFRVLSVTEATNGPCVVVMQPKAAQARRMMPEIRIEFAANDHMLRATELKFADGSTMRNDFANVVLNPGIAETLFTPDIPPDFKVVEPLKGRSP